MKQEEYHLVLKYIQDNKSSSLRDIVEGLAIVCKSTCSYDALLSICLFHYQQQTKQTYWEKTSNKNIEKYFLLYNAERENSEKIVVYLMLEDWFDSCVEACIMLSVVCHCCSNYITSPVFDNLLTIDELSRPRLLALAEDLDISPALLARLIIKEFLNRQESSKSDEENTLHVKSEMSLLLRNPFLIDDKRLSTDVRQCVLNDISYGPVTDAIRHMVGVEYEEKLLNHVKKLNLPFQNEDELRKLGYDKTPDIKLEIPIYVKDQVVCWIESKASFGCPEAHKTYLNEQYYSYWNRFGPGLVIYWYGFVDELADEMLKHEIILMDHFPSQDQIIYFQPKAVKVAKTL